MIEAMLLNALADPVIVLEGMQVTLANNAARSLLGAHIVGDDIRLTLRQPEAAALLASGGDGLAEFSGPGGPDQRLEMRVQAAANGQRVIQIADGSTRHLADRLRTDFVANASHELRTPLATILGFIETLSDEEAGGNSTLRQRFLHVMGSEARRMARLIEELLSLSRIEADRFVLPDTEVHLANLMREVLGETIDADTLQFDLSVNPVIRGDAAQLRQVVHNLIDNARRYGGGDISLSLTERAGQAVISVTDQGSGIAPEHLPRLTQRFYRVDEARSRASGGTGLGLAIVKHIVDRHRGHLDIRSQRGQGTTVTIEMPLTQ